MKQFLWKYDSVRPGLTFQNMTPEERQAAMQHGQYLMSLKAEGKLSHAIQVLDPKGLWGVVLINAASLDEATAWLKNDPFIKGGFFRGEATPARLAINDLPTPAPTPTASAKSTAITKELEGNWEGTLDADGNKLRVILKLANKDGAATGTLISVDQGGAEIPAPTVIQKGSTLNVEAPSIGASFTGEVSKDATAIVGEFAQGMGKLPLTLKRAPK